MGITDNVFFIFYMGNNYLLKQKVGVLQTPEWKFNANRARNATFEGRLGPKSCTIWVKNGKKLIIFKNFRKSQSFCLSFQTKR